VQTTRINNISLFVTVLSACLGLLAAGTAAPIYAQATARSAESALLTGDERRCGLEPEEMLILDSYLRPAREFIADIGRLASIGKYQYGDYEHVDISFRLIKNHHTSSTESFVSTANRWLRVAAEDAAEKIIFAFPEQNIFYRHDDETKLDIAEFEIAFHLNKSGLGIKTTQEQKSEERAQKLAANYNASFAFAACLTKDDFERSFYQNTRAIVKEHKILIITNLPRAALDNPPEAEQPAAN
jgi:hypothetical protein